MAAARMAVSRPRERFWADEESDGEEFAPYFAMLKIRRAQKAGRASAVIQMQQRGEVAAQKTTTYVPLCSMGVALTLQEHASSQRSPCYRSLQLANVQSAPSRPARQVQADADDFL